MKGKICLVTGASSGIGLGTVLQLVKRGARVIMASRPGEKADRAFQEARRRAAYSGAEVEWLPIDLASFSSIERFVREFEKRWPRLNALFNCAGVQYLKRVETTAGLEAMLAVNYLGHFLLTNLLYTRVKAGQPAVVITVSGRGHKRTLGEGWVAGRIDFDDLQSQRKFNFIRAGKQSVLARILFTYELARRWRGRDIYVTTLCPGLTRTGLVRHLPWPARLYFHLRCLVEGAQSPEDAGHHLVCLAERPDLRTIHGRYFEVRRGRLVEVRSSPASYDLETARRLWTVSEELVGRKFEY